MSLEASVTLLSLYCACELYSNVFILGKKIRRLYVFGKKDKWHVKSTSC